MSPTRAAARRKQEMLEVLEERANELLNHYNHQNLESLNKAIRSTLDSVRKRIHATATILYKEQRRTTQRGVNTNNEADDETATLAPFFYSDFTLRIPNVTMNPSLDEIQQAINKCTYLVLSVTKNVTLWQPTLKGMSCVFFLNYFYLNYESLPCCSFPVRTQPQFNVHTTSSQCYGPFIDVQTIFPSKHTTLFQRCNNVVDIQTTLYQRQNDVILFM